MRRQWMLPTAIGIVILAAIVLGLSLKEYLSAPTTEVTVSAADPLNSDPGIAAPTEDVFDPLEPTPQPTVPVATVQPTMVVVYITGAVAQPNTYKLPADARVFDVVQAAGGLTDDADRDHINLADHIRDAQHIHINRIGEAASSTAGTQPTVGATNGLINLNTASAAELDRLPGIGEVLAQRIVDWRTTNGPFTSSEGIKQVKGVSASLYDQIKDQITVQ